VDAGLDVLYIAGGVALVQTLGQTDPFLRGSGWGVVVQGGFLLLFDALHAAGVPREVFLRDPGLFASDLHDAYRADGPKGIVILAHGFPGTPIEMRALGEALQAEGWGVRGLLLPGFGKQVASLFQQRAAAWSDYLAAEVRQAHAEHPRVVLVSFSMGAGLSIPAAAQTRPAALVLAAPFWFDLNPLSDLLLGLASIFLPETFNPFKLIPARRIEQSPEFSPPPGKLYPTAPEFFRGLQDVQLPLLFLEQFAALSRAVRRSAPRLDMPTLVLQGAQDRVVHPALTRKLLRLLPASARFVEVQGEHHIVMPDSEAFPRVRAEILAFLKTLD